jgi:hypothetical protein
LHKSLILEEGLASRNVSNDSSIEGERKPDAEGNNAGMNLKTF